MSENRELLQKTIKSNGKKITDDALNYLENFLDYMESTFENYEDKVNYAKFLVGFASTAANDAKRDIITGEDTDIMLNLLPNEDVTIPFTPIKRLINNKTSKNIKNDAAKILTSNIDEYCKDLLQQAAFVADEKGHEKIRKEDIEQLINYYIS